MGHLSGLELELKEMVGLISRQQDLIVALGEKGAQLDERKTTLGKEVEDLRSNLKDVSSELVKANEVIQKLQDEGTQLSRRLKTQDNILSSQEAQLKAKEERLSQTSAALNGASDRVNKLEKELEELKTIKTDMEERMKVYEETLSTKESMLTYLSKQVIDAEGGSNLMTQELSALQEANIKLKSELEDLRAVHGEVEARCKIAENTATEKEEMVSQLKKQISDSEGLSKLMSQEIQALRKNNNKLDGDYHEKQKAVANLTAKLGGLETELQEKTALIGRQQDLISSLGEKGAQIEERKESLDREVDELKLHLREVSLELEKANEIIRKLQEDGRQLTRKIKSHEKVLISQDNQLKSKAGALNQSQAALKVVTEKLEKLEADMEGMKQTKEELEQRLKTTEETLASKETMITSLCKQLNDYEGLSNLDKFRQTLTLSNSIDESTVGNKNPNTGTPSWMHIYNSTLGSANPTMHSSGNAAGGDGKGKRRSLHPNAFAVVPNPSTATRTPTWAKSNKATLDNLLQKTKK